MSLNVDLDNAFASKTHKLLTLWCVVRHICILGLGHRCQKQLPEPTMTYWETFFENMYLTVSSAVTLVILLRSQYLTRLFNSLRPNDAYMPRWTSHHWFKSWLVAWTAPSHYLNQCWNIVNWTLRNKRQWNFNRNSYVFIQENAFENVVCEMASTLPRPQCVKIGSVCLRVYVHVYLLSIDDKDSCAGDTKRSRM